MTIETAPDAALGRFVREKKLIVCVGSGGVGKTTTSATIALAGAAAGRRTLVLTIDPAKRLADALGLPGLDDTERRVDPARLTEAGLDAPGELYAMMLDAKRTFDDLMARVVRDPAALRRVLDSRLYRLMSGQLAGSQEYMSMERLWLLTRQNRYDLIVLDTPPAKNALDFLDAPDRLARFFDDAVMRWFVREPSGGGVLGGLLALGGSVVSRLLGAITGDAFVRELTEFFTEFKDTYRGFRERALDVETLLRGPDTAFVLVTGPEADHLGAARAFYDKLVEHRLAVGAVVVNRSYHAHAGTAPPAADLLESPTLLGILNADPTLDYPVRAMADRLRAAAAAAAAFNAAAAAGIERFVRGLGPAAPPVYRVPLYARDVHAVADLLALHRRLLSPT